MNPRHVKGLGLVGLFISIAVQTGCGPRSNPTGPNPKVTRNPHRVVTISSVSSVGSNPCEVDFPVTLLRISKHDTIAWVADDHDYWVQIDPSNGIPTPIAQSIIKIAKGTQSSPFSVSINPPSAIYFTYAIYDADPNTVPKPDPCKKSTDDRDTGLNVKP